MAVALFAIYMGGVLTLHLAICKLLRVHQLSLGRTGGDWGLLLATAQCLLAPYPRSVEG